MKRQHRPLATLLMLCLVAPGLATAARGYGIAPVSDPEALGFSASRLARIAAWQQTQVDAGAFSGAVAAIARDGKLAYLRAVGFRDRAKTVPLQPDAIFWIASMTKPVTSVAAMMLVEEGKLDLAAPVYQYLPEIRDMMVGVETKDPVTGAVTLALEPQKRPMTVEDLLRHTSGLVYYDKGTTAVHKLYAQGYFERYARDSTLKDFVSGLARLPLAYQPGEVFEYALNLDVLGRVIEVISGQPLDQFFDKRLFKPLGMVDTAFWVPPEKQTRLVDPPADVAIYPDRDVTKPTTMFSGGGGLVSSAGDYLRFGQMLLNGGELDGVRILSQATVRRMTTDSLPPGIRIANSGGYVGPQGGASWGLGFAIRSDAARSKVPGSVGSFTWNGLWGCYFWVDPAESLIAIQLIQTGKNYDPFLVAFRNLTYGALLIPDRGVPASSNAAIDQMALAAFAGTFRFTTTSSRDKQAPPEFGSLGIEVATQDGLLKVVYPVRGMPAFKAGILAGDIITHVDDGMIQGLSLDQALDRLRGPVDTKVRLRIDRKGQDRPIEVSVVRAQFRLPGADLQVVNKDGRLEVQASGDLPVLDFEKGATIPVVPMSGDEFFVDGGDHTRLAFLRDATGKPTSLVLNPGPWQIMGQRIN